MGLIPKLKVDAPYGCTCTVLDPIVPPPLASVETTVLWFVLDVLALFAIETVSYRSVPGCGIQSLRLPLSVLQWSLAVSIAASVVPSWPSHS